MNRYKVTLNTGATAADKQYTYNVYVNGAVIYTGKAFKISSQASIVIDITDIIGDYQYAGYGIINPSWVNGAYQQPAISEVSISQNPSVEKGLHYAAVMVRLFDGSTQVAQSTVNVYFHNIPFEGTSDQSLISSNISYHFGDMIPRMPRINTSHLRYAQLVHSQNSKQPKWSNGTSNIVSFTNANGSRVISRDLSSLLSLMGSSNDLYADGKKICHFDECVQDGVYYLMWITDNGGMQCQRFRATSVYSEEETRNMKLSTDDMNDIANASLKGKWKLKSENLTDDEYRQYMSINRSPYLLLYIPRLDRAVYVNVSDNTMEQKKYLTNSRKFPYFEVNVETREQLVSIF